MGDRSRLERDTLQGGQREHPPRDLLLLVRVDRNGDHPRRITGEEEEARGALVTNRAEHALERSVHAVRTVVRAVLEDTQEVRLGLLLFELGVDELPSALQRHRRRDRQLVTREDDVVVVVHLPAKLCQLGENLLLCTLLLPLIAGCRAGSHRGSPFPYRHTGVCDGAPEAPWGISPKMSGAA